MKKIKGLVLVPLILPFLLASCKNDAGVDDIPVGEKDTSMFSAGDLKSFKGEDYTGTIDLSDLTDNYTITSPGVYHVKGTTNYQLIVNDNSSNIVHLILDNTAFTNSKTAPIYVKKSDKVVIHLLGDNSIVSTYKNEVLDGTSEINGAIYSEDDLTISGTGSLNISSALHGIVCKDDLKIVSGDISIKATKRGIDTNDSFRMRDGKLEIESNVGIKLKSKKDNSFLYVEGGEIDITSYDEGIDLDYNVEATGYMKFVSGVFNITSGTDSNPAKAIKCASSIEITGGKFNINAKDDGFHSTKELIIQNSNINVSSEDDCIHSDEEIIVKSGNMTLDGHEGLESDKVTVKDGNIVIHAKDDGINASSSVTIDGGYIDITLEEGDVDGIDSNGTYLQTGGLVVSRIPDNSIEGCGAISATKGVTFTGGTFIGVGSFTTANTVNTSLCMATLKQSLEAGSYTVSNTTLKFDLAKTYNQITIVSNELELSKNYELIKDGNSIINWTQSSTSGVK